MAGYASRIQSQSEFLFKDEKVAVDFLDYRELDNHFVFPFGLKEEAQDFHFSGLKAEYRLASYDRACVLPDLGRSGRDLRFSYNLRSVEPTPPRSKEPWSIRQCAVYHTFDVENGKMLWIIVKANKEIQKRVTEVSDESTQSGNPLKRRSNAFAAALQTHLLLCNWSGENWRCSTFGDEKTLLASPETTVSPELPSVSSDGGADTDDKFTFKNLQAIQHIEEKAQEAMLVLKLNTEVLEQLRLHYDEVAEHADFPQELKDGCKANLHRFNKGIIGVEKDMQMLQSRTETLLHLLANRKNLMSGILQHRSSKASEFYAKESRESAARMEIMTVKMQDLAMKTKQETVSMRVITTVTLFFLPATFIATFMSTDILNFEHGKQDLQMQGLRLYLMIALPATALTFVAWYFIYYFARREARSNDRSEAVGEA
ncbi:uncharacterized protein J4E78_008802 [Alternaria triticimaculans]|uniref:uncharacterized protein n=1 Tax=Alternaria triticimaculans TaxID=297637 RepID=UPI0020C441C5|nr:uncharacterized protein J4E78_008802 [Alternaria triticimaculans]KAI4647488.1 hypothetical protein J4E78_008802 [Alternaria triticimaculans]